MSRSAYQNEFTKKIILANEYAENYLNNLDDSSVYGDKLIPVAHSIDYDKKARNIDQYIKEAMRQSISEDNNKRFLNFRDFFDNYRNILRHEGVIGTSAQPNVTSRMVGDSYFVLNPEDKVITMAFGKSKYNVTIDTTTAMNVLQEDPSMLREQYGLRYNKLNNTFSQNDTIGSAIYSGLESRLNNLGIDNSSVNENTPIVHFLNKLSDLTPYGTENGNYDAKAKAIDNLKKEAVHEIAK